MSIEKMIDYIFVCEGEEFKAVQNALFLSDFKGEIIPIPIGFNSVNNLLKNRQISQNKSVMLIGLGGSLSPDYSVGDVVIYESCNYFYEGNLITKICDLELNKSLINKLNCSVVKGLTTDTLIHTSRDKKNLSKQSYSSVVDMESFAILSYFESATVVRVISDNYDDNLPDLNSAITPDGKLDNLKMAIAFLREPFKAIKLIKNALISLKQLGAIASKIGQINNTLLAEVREQGTGNREQ